MKMYTYRCSRNITILKTGLDGYMIGKESCVPGPARGHDVINRDSLKVSPNSGKVKTG
jgi:hypothetical protein